MAIAEDGTTPAAATAAGSAAISSAAFSPPANSFLVAVCSIGNSGSGTTTGSVASTGGLTWTMQKRSNASALGSAEIWTAPCVAAPGSITVTLTPTTGLGKVLAVRVLTGCAASPIGANAGKTSGTTAQQALTTTAAGSVVYGALTDNSANQAALTALASTTNISWFNNSSDGESQSTYKSAAASGAPGSVTYGYSAGAAHTYLMALLEILPLNPSPPPPMIAPSQATMRASSW